MSGIVAETVGVVRAWCWLVLLSFRRVWWSVQTLVALGLIFFLSSFVLIRGLFRPWDMALFSNNVLINLYVAFVLPILTVCVGTQSMGGDWEDRSLVWLLTRPIPRPLVYLAKFVAIMPWAFGLTLGGMAVIGLAAGTEGLRAFRYFWPAIAWGTLAYLALFQLLGCAFHRSTIIGVVYCFVIETLFGSMPGMVKRGSISFYVKCLVYDYARQLGMDKLNGDRGIAPEPTSFFNAVPGQTAWTMLVIISGSLFVLGLIVFARKEYRDLT